MHTFCPSSQRQQIVVKAFCLDSPIGDFQEVGLKLMDKDPDPRDTLERRSQAGIGDKFWTDPGFTFLDTRFGRERIKREVCELEEAGFGPSLLKSNERGFLLLKIQNHELIAVPPREFPLNPPRLFWRETGEEIGPLGMVGRWNSDLSILKVVEEIRRKLGMRYYSCKWRRQKCPYWRAFFSEVSKWMSLFQRAR